MNYISELNNIYQYIPNTYLINKYKIVTIDEDTCNYGIHMDGMNRISYYDPEDKLICKAAYNSETGQIADVYVIDKDLLKYMLEDIRKRIRFENSNTIEMWESLCMWPKIWKNMGGEERIPLFNNMNHMNKKKIHGIFKRGIKTGGCVLKINT